MSQGGNGDALPTHLLPVAALAKHKLGHGPDPVSRRRAPSPGRSPMHGERDNSVTLTPAAAAPRPAPGICSRTGSEAVSDICLRRDSSPRGEERGLCGLPARAAAGRVLSSTAPRWPGARWRAREAALGAHARPHPPSAGPRPGARVGPGKAGRALSISPRPGSWPGGKPPRGREWFLPPLGTVSSGTPDAGFLEAWPRLGEGHGTLPPRTRTSGSRERLLCPKPGLCSSSPGCTTT